jgi:hypothetical protein
LASQCSWSCFQSVCISKSLFSFPCFCSAHIIHVAVGGRWTSDRLSLLFIVQVSNFFVSCSCLCQTVLFWSLAWRRSFNLVLAFLIMRIESLLILMTDLLICHTLWPLLSDLELCDLATETYVQVTQAAKDMFCLF